MSDEIIDVEPVDEAKPTVAALTRREQMEKLPALVAPVADQHAIVGAFDAYRQARDALLLDSDYQEFYENGRRSRFVKRSGWRKLAIAYAVSFEIRERNVTRNDRGETVEAEFVVRATAPNGRFSDGWGECNGYERCCQTGCRRKHRHCPAESGSPCSVARHFSKPGHDIPATAETRAKNRAAADLFGMGEVSAEEITALDRGEPEPEPPAPKVSEEPLELGPDVDAEEAFNEAMTLVGSGVPGGKIDDIVTGVRRLFALMIQADVWPADSYAKALTKAKASRLADVGKKADIVAFAGRVWKFAEASLSKAIAEDAPKDRQEEGALLSGNTDQEGLL